MTEVIVRKPDCEPEVQEMSLDFWTLVELLGGVTAAEAVPGIDGVNIIYNRDSFADEEMFPNVWLEKDFFVSDIVIFAGEYDGSAKKYKSLNEAKRKQVTDFIKANDASGFKPTLKEQLMEAIRKEYRFYKSELTESKDKKPNRSEKKFYGKVYKYLCKSKLTDNEYYTLREDSPNDRISWMLKWYKQENRSIRTRKGLDRFVRDYISHLKIKAEQHKSRYYKSANN